MSTILQYLKKLNPTYLFAIASIIFYFLWSSSSDKVVQLQKEIEQLKNEVVSTKDFYNTKYKQQNEINERLNKELENLQSNECGKQPVPQYLLNAQKELLK